MPYATPSSSTTTTTTTTTTSPLVSPSLSSHSNNQRSFSSSSSSSSSSSTTTLSPSELFLGSNYSIRTRASSSPGTIQPTMMMITNSNSSTNNNNKKTTTTTNHNHSSQPAEMKMVGTTEELYNLSTISPSESSSSSSCCSSSSSTNTSTSSSSLSSSSNSSSTTLGPTNTNNNNIPISSPVPRSIFVHPATPISPPGHRAPPPAPQSPLLNMNGVFQNHSPVIGFKNHSYHHNPTAFSSLRQPRLEQPHSFYAHHRSSLQLDHLQSPSPSSSSTTAALYTLEPDQDESNHRPMHQKTRSETDMTGLGALKNNHHSSSYQNAGYQGWRTITKKSGQPLRSSLKPTNYHHHSNLSTPFDTPPITLGMTTNINDPNRNARIPSQPTTPILGNDENNNQSSGLAMGVDCASTSSNSPTTYVHTSKLSKSAPSTPSASIKYVHFDSHLEHVRHFLAQQRPIAVSRDGSPIETETEGEEEFPFPMMMKAVNPMGKLMKSVEQETKAGSRMIEFEDQKSSSLSSSWEEGNVRLKSLELNQTGKEIRGIVKVRNIGFEKIVAARFTFDDWRTISEVSGEYERSIDEWDMFVFKIRVQEGTPMSSPKINERRKMMKVQDFGQKNGNVDGQAGNGFLKKKMWLVIRYKVGGNEFWDNNLGKNYLIKIGKESLDNEEDLKQDSKVIVVEKEEEEGMIELREKLDRLVGDDLGIHEVNNINNNNRQKMIGLNSLMATSQLKSGGGRGLSARYDFGLSLKKTVEATSSSSSSNNQHGGIHHNPLGFNRNQISTVGGGGVRRYQSGPPSFFFK